jgi:OmpA-OmpF porin, OOP family
MPSSSARAVLPIATLAVLAFWPERASAQQKAEGFALDRFYQSAPGGGWFVMDTLDMHGGLGGVMSLTTEQAHDPLRVRTTNGSQRLAVVSDEAIADFGFAATYGRWRLYLNLDMPLDVSGNSGTVGAYQFTAPNSSQPFTPSGVNPSTAPDTFSDARVGLDVRLFGSSNSPLRIGASAQLLVPSPNTYQSEYLTDGTFRAMGRVLFAGDIGMYSYAAQLGVHVRPYDATPTPGSPEGSELLFGAAVGRRFSIGDRGAIALVLGPEVYGETAFRSFFGADATGVEGLFTGRVEGTADDGPQIRVKLGVGGGLDARFGAPEWRIAAAIELFDHSTDSDGDGVFDAKDACPRTPGVKTKDPKTNGCPPDRDGDGVSDSDDACPDAPGPKTIDLKTTGCPGSANGTDNGPSPSLLAPAP